MLKSKYKYNGVIDEAMLFAEKSQLLKPELWKRFVLQFREDADFDGGWRGEYWGKMMRGACFVYAYTQNEELYDILPDRYHRYIGATMKEGEQIIVYDEEDLGGCNGDKIVEWLFLQMSKSKSEFVTIDISNYIHHR